MSFTVPPVLLLIVSVTRPRAPTGWLDTVVCAERVDAREGALDRQLVGDVAMEGAQRRCVARIRDSARARSVRLAAEFEIGNGVVPAAADARSIGGDLADQIDDGRGRARRDVDVAAVQIAREPIGRTAVRMVRDAGPAERVGDDEVVERIARRDTSGRRAGPAVVSDRGGGSLRSDTPG